MQKFEVTFPKLNSDGIAVTNFDNRLILAPGVYPTERVVVEVVKKRKAQRQVVPVEFVTPIRDRIEAHEDHYLSCSPWQTLNYAKQLEFKKGILTDLYNNHFPAAEIEYVGADKTWGYRTKIEFSFFSSDDEEKLFLAFFKRGTAKAKYTLEKGCELASPNMNEVALKMVEILNGSHVSARSLKTLTLRESKASGEIVASLLIKDTTLKLNIKLADLPQCVKGLQIAYSNPLSPASNIDKIISEEGNLVITEKILNQEIKYLNNSFFQNNVEVFQKALVKIVEAVTPVKKLVELYCGVGTIGMQLTYKAKEVVGIELDDQAVKFANNNARRNEITNYKAVAVAAESAQLELLEGADVIVLDPPRTGLHPDVIKMLNKLLPKRIIYLSCNPQTQVRDYLLLKEKYKISLLNGFDFYPHTLHMESLIVLDRV